MLLILFFDKSKYRSSECCQILKGTFEMLLSDAYNIAKCFALPRLAGNVCSSLKSTSSHARSLITLPISIDRLVILDLRNNSLHTLPSAFDKMQSLKDLAVWGNPICRYGCQSCSSKMQTLLDIEGLGCTKQCSDICLNSDIATPGCVISCNVSSCDYSNGECLTASFD